MRTGVFYSLLRLVAILGVALASPRALGQEYVPGELIVKLKGEAGTGSSYAFIGKATSIQGMSLKGQFVHVNTYHFKLQKGQSVEDKIQELKADPDVEYAEPNYILKKATTTEQVEVFSTSEIVALQAEGGFKMSGADIGASLAKPHLSSLSVNGFRPIVAIIDTGLDVNHPVFHDSGALWINPDEVAGNGVDDDGNGCVDDIYGCNFINHQGVTYDDDGHGTHVAGIILNLDGAGMDIFTAPFNNKDPLIRIMPLKFLDEHGIGKTSDAIAAINYAVSKGAHVINNSWGGPGFSQALSDSVCSAFNKGISFPAAAGNSGLNNDVQPMYPASYSAQNVISVAATTDSDYLAGFSNYGPGSVHLGSPGVYIMSTYPNNTYGASSGTSMATPFISGLAALMIRENPDLKAHQIRKLINDQASVVSQLDHKVITGGRVDIDAAISAAMSATPEASPGSCSSSGYNRDLASSIKSSGGCGTVAKLYSELSKNGGGSPPPQGPWLIVLISALLFLPLLFIQWYRQRTPANRRKHDRFLIDSAVTLKLGERKLSGQISSISLGGVQLNTDALLEKGGVVNMSISSPDGQEQITVQGRVVWSEERKAYGVQFAEVQEGVRATISRWTSHLVRQE